jgi:Uncharacterised nucleotidyltransferase
VTELDVLLWAAGGSPPSGDADLDEDRLLVLARAHQLATRLHRRLASGPPRWAGPRLVAEVAALADEAHRRVREQYAALAEMRAAVPEGARPLVTKGMAHLFLTGDERMLRRFHDLDLFSREPAEVVAALTRLGYRIDVREPPHRLGRRIWYWIATASRGDCNVDLHGRFPAWSYPAGLDVAACSPTGHPGAWRCPDTLLRGEIGAGALFAHAVERAGLDGEPVLITDAEMTVLVGCCHVFTDYLVEFGLPYARIKLGELANLGQLVSSPAFRWPAFERLAREHRAEDAVAYVLALLDRWLGIRRDPSVGARFPGQPVPPRTLWQSRGRGGFVVSLAAVEPPEDAVVRTTTAGELVRHLGGEAVAAERWYGTPGLDAASLARRLLHGDELAARLCLRRTPAGLELAVGVAGAGEPGQMDVLAWFGDTIVECVAHETGELFAYDRRREQRLDPGVVPFRRLEGGQDGGLEHAATTIPWSMLPARDAPGAEIPLLLGVRRWPPDGEWPRASALFPVLLQPAG